MKQLLFIFIFLKISLFAGVFEHLLGQDRDYLFEHNFRCHDNICLSPEKNIFNQDEINKSVKLIKVTLDNEEKVFEIGIELNLEGYKKEAFYNAIIQLSDENTKITTKLVYDIQETNDKYGNHYVITITDELRSKAYVDFLIKKYKKLMLQTN